MNLDKIKKLGIYLLILGLASVAYVWGKREYTTTLEKEYEARYAERERQLTEIHREKTQKIVEQYQAIITELEKKIVETEKETIFNKDGTVVVKEKTKTKSTKKKDTKVAKNKETTKETKENKSETKEKSKESEEKTKEKIVKETIAPPSWRVYGTALLTEPSQPKRSSYGVGFMYDVGPFNAGAYGLHSPDTKEAALGFTLGVAF